MSTIPPWALQFSSSSSSRSSLCCTRTTSSALARGSSSRSSSAGTVRLSSRQPCGQADNCSRGGWVYRTCDVGSTVTELDDGAVYHPEHVAAGCAGVVRGEYLYGTWKDYRPCEGGEVCPCSGELDDEDLCGWGCVEFFDAGFWYGFLVPLVRYVLIGDRCRDHG